jgi:hypothetical protein
MTDPIDAHPYDPYYPYASAIRSATSTPALLRSRYLIDQANRDIEGTPHRDHRIKATCGQFLRDPMLL